MGQTQTKTFDNEQKCLKEAEKLLNEKLKKGYLESTSINLQTNSNTALSSTNIFSKKTQKIAKAFEAKLPEAVKKLNKTNWDALYQNILTQLDALWKQLPKKYQEPLGGICICWDDCSVNMDKENTGWFVMAVEGEADLEILKELGSFEGGEKGISLERQLAEMLPYESRQDEGWDLLNNVIKDLLMPLMEEALKTSVKGQAFTKMKKAGNVHIFTGRYHDEEPSHLLSIGSKQNLTKSSEKFISKFIEEYGEKWKTIFKNSHWNQKYEQKYHQDPSTQDEIGSELFVFLDVYGNQPDQLSYLAQQLPNSPHTISSPLLGWAMSCYLTISGNIAAAAIHLQQVEYKFIESKMESYSIDYIHFRNFVGQMLNKKNATKFRATIENWNTASKQNPKLYDFYTSTM
ncbi:WGR domain-containing protein [Leptospira noguchii]|uniref:WGR domain-containing protein n=1 Tax=Leptospira noguchii TaxID=28182 RepID=UPI000AE802CB|nr:WGR domain-containing protein [Leptospira noguchii]UOG59046.1 WGR domain-containing protein [Leptospira noguchii]